MYLYHGLAANRPVKKEKKRQKEIFCIILRYRAYRTVSCNSNKLVVCHVSMKWAQVHSQHSYMSHSIMVIVVVH